MSRIEQTFKNLKSAGKKAFIPYIAAGDPDQVTSQAILNALPEAGADIIELGIPFTDPVADGPTIQAATSRALKNGMTLSKVLDMVRDFRSAGHTDVPVVLMGYYNPIYKYGCEQFISAAREVGVDGLIIVDLPPEESSELADYANEAEIDLIRLVTPVSEDARLETLLKQASGFLYYVSVTGVTGGMAADKSVVRAHIQHIQSKTDLPVVIGFGIKTPEDVQAFKEVADGVVVGSALVEEIEKNPETCVQSIPYKVKLLSET